MGVYPLDIIKLYNQANFTFIPISGSLDKYLNCSFSLLLYCVFVGFFFK